jgi:hypothetical protein
LIAARSVLSVLIVLEDEIPPVEAVFAAIGDHVAVEPDAVLAWRCQ